MVFKSCCATALTAQLLVLLVAFSHRAVSALRFWQFTHGGADFVAHPEVEATLLVHGVVDAGEFGQLRPVVFEGVVQQAVVGAAREREREKPHPQVIHPTEIQLFFYTS